jgi:hypothetical protein
MGPPTAQKYGKRYQPNRSNAITIDARMALRVKWMSTAFILVMVLQGKLKHAKDNVHLEPVF